MTEHKHYRKITMEDKGFNEPGNIYGSYPEEEKAKRSNSFSGKEPWRETSEPPSRNV